MAYLLDAAAFDGTNDYTRRTIALTNQSASSKGIFSCWINFDSSRLGFTQYMYIDDGTGRIAIAFTSGTPRFTINLKNSAGVQLLNFDSAATVWTTNVWYHVLASWDTNFSAGNKLSHLFINDVSDKTVVTDAAGPDNIYYEGTDLYAFGNFATFGGAAADFYLNTESYLDFSVESNRRKFITSALCPVDLGADGSTPTGTVPAIFYHLDEGEVANNFVINAGEGGSFTLTGALTTASTSPSDACAVTPPPPTLRAAGWC